MIGAAADNLNLDEEQRLLLVRETFEKDEIPNPQRISFRGIALYSGSSTLSGDTLTSTLDDGSTVSFKLSPLSLSSWEQAGIPNTVLLNHDGYPMYDNELAHRALRISQESETAAR